MRPTLRVGLVFLVIGCSREMSAEEFYRAEGEANCRAVQTCPDSPLSGLDYETCLSEIEDAIGEGEQWIADGKVVCYDQVAARECIDGLLALEESCTSFRDQYPSVCFEVWQLYASLISGSEEPRCEDWKHEEDQ